MQVLQHLQSLHNLPQLLLCPHTKRHMVEQRVDLVLIEYILEIFAVGNDVIVTFDDLVHLEIDVWDFLCLFLELAFANGRTVFL